MTSPSTSGDSYYHSRADNSNRCDARRGGRRDRPGRGGGSSSDSSHSSRPRSHDSRRSRWSRTRGRRSYLHSRSAHRSNNVSHADLTVIAPADASGPARKLRVLACSTSCDHLTPLRTMDEAFKGVVNFQIYRLDDRSTRYDTKDAKRTSIWQHRMTAMMRSYHLDRTELIQIFLNLPQFRSACILNGGQKGAATLVISYFPSWSPQEKVNDMLAPPVFIELDGTDGPLRSAT